MIFHVWYVLEQNYPVKEHFILLAKNKTKQFFADIFYLLIGKKQEKLRQT